MNLAAVDPEHARDVARQILGGRRYKGSPVPRPLHGVLRWIGDRFASIAHWIGDRFSWLPGPPNLWGYGLAFATVALVTVFLVKALVDAQARSRAARLGADADHRRGALLDDPAALELAAADAELHGDLALAVRLRFRAGLLRLDRDAHAISYRPSIPTSEVRAELSSPTFDGIADTFESVTYGGSDAEPDDTAEAKREWPRVLQAARRR
jgi:hypothetical protein